MNAEDTDSRGENPWTGTELRRSVGAYLNSKAVGDEDAPGNYASNAANVLKQFVEFVEDEADVATLDDLAVRHLRAYGRDLRSAWRSDEYTAGTANTYFRTVRAFLAWCVRDGLLDRNPAADSDATEPLPKDTVESEPQFWSQEARHDLRQWVQQRASSAYDRPMLPAARRLQRTRNHALVALLADSGVRGAELVRDPRDARRDGATWGDLDWEDAYIEVLGKSQQPEEAPFPEVAQRAVRQYRRELEPASEAWPLFPTGHLPTLYEDVREGLRAAGESETRIEQLTDEHAPLDLCREYEIVPTAMTTSGARNVMERLCEAAGVAVDGDYLKPHGGRRLLGDELYRHDPTESQRALRHASIGQTHDAYSHIEAKETGQTIDDLRSSDGDDG